MNKRIKEAFDNIHAEEELKMKTKAFLLSKTQKAEKSKWIPHKRLIPVLACLVFLFFGFGGYWIYFTPAATISIDVNPSIELGVNRFDKVVSIEGYNEDGRTFANSLNIKYMNYEEAVQQILASDSIAVLLSQNELLTITVVGPDEKRCEKILSDMESCTNEHANTYCHCAASDEVAAAHEAGLSYGKYKAFLELQTVNPNLTLEDIQDMTMKEIQDLLKELPASESDSIENKQHHGAEHGHGHE